MQKLCFAVEFCICISNRIPCVKISSNEANCRDGVSLTWIWKPGRTSALEMRFNPIQDGLFPVCSRMGETFLAPPA